MINEDKFKEYYHELMTNPSYYRKGKNKTAIYFGGVYALFDSNMTVLYIGQSLDIYMRVWRQHKYGAMPWVYAKAVILSDEEERRQFESWCIKKLNPKYNKNSGKKPSKCKNCDNSGYFLKDGERTRCTYCNWMGQKDEV